MTDVVCLNPDFSTTRRVTRRPPLLVDEPGSKLARVLSREPHPQLRGEGGLRLQGYFKTGANEAVPAGEAGGESTPLISIITIVFNGEKTLEQTISSVLGQSYDNVEYIIIDGGSKDGTLETIRKYEHAIDYWISEPDEGISDAFNKGIALCTGEYHVVLNADDWYDVDGIKELVGGVVSQPGAVLVCADARVVDEEQNFIKYYRSAPNNLMAGMTLAHNTCLMLTSAVAAVGAYDLGKRVAMDHHLVLRLLAASGAGRFVKIDRCVSNYRMGGISDKFAAAGFKEVRDNVISYGVSPALANAQYWLHIIKHEVSRWLYRFRLAK